MLDRFARRCLGLLGLQNPRLFAVRDIDASLPEDTAQVGGELVQHRLDLLVGGFGVVQDGDLTREGEVILSAPAGLAWPFGPGVDDGADRRHRASEVRLAAGRLRLHVGEGGLDHLLAGVDLGGFSIPFGQTEGDGERATQGGLGLDALKHKMLLF